MTRTDGYCDECGELCDKSVCECPLWCTNPEMEKPPEQLVVTKPMVNGVCPNCGFRLHKRPKLVLEESWDAYTWIVNGVASVHDFTDPVWHGARDSDKFGFYVAGNKWVVGFDSKEEAGEAAIDLILAQGRISDL